MCRWLAYSGSPIALEAVLLEPERSLIDQTGYFDESLPTHEDWDLWIRMSEICDFVHVPMMTCVVDQTRTGMMHDAHSMNRGHEMVMAKYG